jgi:hypothetical protein
VLHILSDPILASVPDGSLEFMNLSEDSVGIFKEKFTRSLRPCFRRLSPR